MLRRFGSISIFAVVLAGWFLLSMGPHSVWGDEPQEKLPEVREGKEVEVIRETTASRASARDSIPAPPPGRQEGMFDLSTPNKAEEKIRAALVSPKGVDIEFIDTPLMDAADFIANSQGLSIIIDEQALQEAGVATDEPINRTLSGVSLASALKIILDPLELTYLVEDEVLKITTQAAADEKRFTRTYHTGYLKQVGIEPAALKQTIQTVIEPGTWHTSGDADARGGARDPENPQAKSSKAAPSPKNAINVLGDMVVVSAPQNVHRKINDLLIQLDRRWELQTGTK